ncbi:MAG TPA: DNA repair protein RecO C-terminal domain-containing protein [Planctomycetota bacterium]|nr:DNA repair protein RecO C-terminal domain-containing protein [Planctomycetota bacterium]
MSGPLKTFGIVLARWDFGNTSRVLSFLTPDRGRLGVLAKGARRPKGTAGLGGGLDLLSQNEILCYERRGGGLAILAEWSELCNPAAELGTDPVRFAASAVLVEYARECSAEGEDSAELFRLLAAGTALAVSAERLIPAALASALAMLSSAGFRPAFETCAGCGGGRPVGGGRGAAAVLSAAQGGMLCAGCAELVGSRAAEARRRGRGGAGGGSGLFRLSGEAAALLGALLRMTPEAGARLRPSRGAERELLGAVEGYASWRLEKGMRSLTALGAMVGRLEAVGCR